MTETKSYADSFRIRNYEDQLASVWQIGNGDFFAVKFDEDDEPLIYTRGDVSNAFRNGWIIVGEEPVKEETLPRTFKFKVVQNGALGNIIYTYKETQGANNISWGLGNMESIHYDVESVRRFIKDGTWIVLPSEDTKLDWDKILDVYNEIVTNRTAPPKEDVIHRIKSATEVYDMTIFIDGGTYNIYDNLCDVSYKADTDEKLIEILNAIDFLSEQVA